MYKLQWIVLLSYFLYLNVQSQGNSILLYAKTKNKKNIFVLFFLRIWFYCKGK